MWVILFGKMLICGVVMIGVLMIDLLYLVFFDWIGGLVGNKIVMCYLIFNGVIVFVSFFVVNRISDLLLCLLVCLVLFEWVIDIWFFVLNLNEFVDLYCVVNNVLWEFIVFCDKIELMLVYIIDFFEWLDKM